MKVLKDLNKLWLLNLNTNVYKCYDHDKFGNRILIGEYHKRDVKREERSSFEDAKKSLNGHSYKGVTLHKRSYESGAKNFWHSKLHLPTKNGKRKSVHVGAFRTSTEAAIAWNNAVIEAGLESVKGLNKV